MRDKLFPLVISFMMLRQMVIPEANKACHPHVLALRRANLDGDDDGGDDDESICSTSVEQGCEITPCSDFSC